MPKPHRSISVGLYSCRGEWVLVAQGLTAQQLLDAEPVTVAQAAERLGITQAMVRHYVVRRKIPRINPVCPASCDVADLGHRHVLPTARAYYRLIDVARAERDSRRRLLRGRKIA